MELNPSEISKLMILNGEKRKRCILGYRFKGLKPLNSKFDWGNFMFTCFFNISFNSNHRDILCCAKAFYKKMTKNKDDLKKIEFLHLEKDS